MSYNVEAIVKFNDGIAYVLDKPIEFKFYKQGSLIIGLDDSCTFISCYYYDRPTPGFYAFGGRKFDIHLENGEVEHCYGQWWSGGHSKAAELLGEELVHVTYETKDELKKCYVFTGSSAIKSKLEELRQSYSGEIYGYWDYEAKLKGWEAPRR